MKRISTLLLSAAMAFGAVGAAQAATLKASGNFDFAFGHLDSMTFKNSNRGKGEDTFTAYQRVRPQFSFIASENLKGVVMFEIGKMDWGKPNTLAGKSGDQPARSGAGLDADGVNIKTKRAFMDWVIPNTASSIRMGIQGLALPSATDFGNPVFNADVAGIVNTNKINDMVDLTAFWLRLFDQYAKDGDSTYADGKGNSADEMDMFGLVVPVKGDGWKVTPWAMYANIGNASGFYEYSLSNNFGTGGGKTPIGNPGNDTAAWWIGTALNVQIIDNLSFATDIMYGKLHSVDIGDAINGDLEASGWWMDAALNYKIENLGTAGLFGWYASGDGKNDGNEIGRMPVVGTDAGVFFTSFGFAGYSDSFGYKGATNYTGTGTWGLGIQLADVSFVDKLSHTLRFAYYEGTNNKDSSFVSSTNISSGAWGADKTYMTTEDNAFEVNFDHSYKIYENLTAYLDLGYINMDMGKRNGVDLAPDEAWKAQLRLRYAF